MNDTLKNLRDLLSLEIVAETSWTLNSAEIYALRGLFAENKEQAAEIARLQTALDEIVQEHDMYCENHIGVSNHAYKLAAIARAAREKREAANE